MLRVLRISSVLRPSFRQFINRQDVDEQGMSLKKKTIQETDYYKILEVPRYASQEEIKRKYHHLAKIHHPDAGGDSDMFVLIQTAFATLSDTETRNSYNKEKHEKEKTRIKFDDTTDEELRFNKISEIMKSVTVTHTRPDYTDATLIIGMVNPKPLPPTFAVACPLLLVANLGLFWAIKEGLFSEVGHQLTEYMSTKRMSATDMRVEKMKIFTLPIVAGFLGLGYWVTMHHYFHRMARHLNYPGLQVSVHFSIFRTEHGYNTTEIDANV